jgi:hypothetical protein
MENEQILNGLFTNVHDMLKYYADVKLDEIANRKPRIKLSSEQIEMLYKLILTKAGREALLKVLIDYGGSNFFTLLADIDGASGEKTVELVNADSGEPLAENTLHEHYCLHKRK